jgi:hypothetical protein
VSYWLLVYFFDPSGDFLWKDVIPVESYEQCTATASQLTGILINSDKSTSYFCIAEDELELRARDIEMYEKQLRISENVQVSEDDIDESGT